jgi:hypothetical protein
MKTDNLKIALTNLLGLAQEKLRKAKIKNSVWDIQHYTKDVQIVKFELKAHNENR